MVLGQTGNNQIGALGWRSTYGSGDRSKYAMYGNDSPITYYSVSRFANPGLKWEETFEYNLGIDLNAYNGRVDLVMDLYQRDSYDLLFNKPLPETTGFESTRANLGRVRNTGMEIMLTTRNVSTPVFMWKTAFSFTYNKNEVLDLGDENEAVYSRWSTVEGYPIGMGWVYLVDRIFQVDDFNYDEASGRYTIKED